MEGGRCKITVPFPNVYYSYRRKIEGLKKYLGLKNIEINAKCLSDLLMSPNFTLLTAEIIRYL